MAKDLKFRQIWSHSLFPSYHRNLTSRPPTLSHLWNWFTFNGSSKLLYRTNMYLLKSVPTSRGFSNIWPGWFCSHGAPFRWRFRIRFCAVSTPVDMHFNWNGSPFETNNLFVFMSSLLWSLIPTNALFYLVVLFWPRIIFGQSYFPFSIQNQPKN